MGLLGEEAVGERVGEAIAGGLAGAAVGGAEQVVPQRQLGRVVLAGRRVVDRVVPAMELGAVEDVRQPAEPEVDVGVDPHAGHDADRALVQHDVGRCAEQDHRGDLDGLVDDDLERVRPRAGDPVDLARRVVGLVQPPQQRDAVLGAVEPVDVEIVADDEQRELGGQRPAGDQAVTGRDAGGSGEPADQAVDHDRQHGALDQRVADQIDAEAAAPEPLVTLHAPWQ